MGTRRRAWLRARWTRAVSAQVLHETAMVAVKIFFAARLTAPVAADPAAEGIRLAVIAPAATEVTAGQLVSAKHQARDVPDI